MTDAEASALCRMRTQSLHRVGHHREVRPKGDQIVFIVFWLQVTTQESYSERFSALLVQKRE